MPRRRPVHGLGGTLVDHRHVHQAAGSARVWAAVRLTAAAAGAQRVRHLAVQPAQLRAVDRLIDRLGHQVQFRPVGKLHPQRLADLLRAPPLLQPLGHELSQHQVINQLAATGPCPPIHGQPLRGERTVSTLPSSRLRRSSRLTVDGLRPTSTAIARTDRPRRCRSAILTRSSSDKYRGEISAFRIVTTGG